MLFLRTTETEPIRFTISPPVIDHSDEYQDELDTEAWLSVFNDSETLENARTHLERTFTLTEYLHEHPECDDPLA